MSGNRFRDSMLLAAGASSFVIALVHLAIMFIGAPAYRWFGAPSLAVEVERGSIVPAVLCIVVAAILSLWGLYALAGAGRIKALPLVRTALFVIGTIYLLRGLLAVPQIVSIVSGQDVAPLRYLGFSLVSGITGVLYLGGLMSFSRGTRAHNLKSISA